MLHPLTSPRCSLSPVSAERLTTVQRFLTEAASPQLSMACVHHWKVCIHCISICHVPSLEASLIRMAFSLLLCSGQHCLSPRCIQHNCNLFLWPHPFWSPTSQILLPCFYFFLNLPFTSETKQYYVLVCGHFVERHLHITESRRFFFCKGWVSQHMLCTLLSICLLTRRFYPYLHWCELCFNKHMGKSNLLSIFQFIWR